MRRTTVCFGVALDAFHPLQGDDTYQIKGFHEEYSLCFVLLQMQQMIQSLVQMQTHGDLFHTATGKEGRAFFLNRWRDHTLPLRQRYLVMSPGASVAGVRSQRGEDGAI